MTATTWNRLATGAILLATACACPYAHDTVPKQTPLPTPSPVASPQPSPSPTPEPEPMPKPAFAYPPTRVGADVDTLHGVKVADPYRWLEDAKAPEVAGWMAAQDAFTRAHLHALPGRDALAERLRQLYYVDSISAPRHRKGRFFYTRTLATKEKAIVYWKQGEKGAEKVLLDPNLMSADGSTSLGTWEPTDDGKRVVYALRKNNADEATLYVLDVATGKNSDMDVIEGAKYADPTWTPAGDGFYYTYLPTDPSIPTAERPGWADVRFHKLGTDPKTDTVVHDKTGNPEAFIGAQLSKDGRWLLTYVQHGWNATDVYLRDLKSKDTAWKTFVEGVKSQFIVLPWKNFFYIVTNDGAPKWRVFKTAAGVADRAQWKEIVPESKDDVIDNAQIIGQHLVLTMLENATSELRVLTLDGKLVRNVPLPGIGSTGGMAGNPDEDDAYFGFTSFTTPQQIHRTSIKTGKTSLWAEVKLPIDATPYQVEQVFYPSKDGTKISMFIVHRKDMPKDGSTPFLLAGYGGFNVSMTPGFSSGLYPWLEAGGGYAMPNLRGGGEYGEDWHKAGMLGNKQNVFDDFAAAGEWLVANKYTQSDRLAIRGGSNGGLLVGAALTQRPELWRAAICAVPLLDMVRYHKFGSGKTWIPEYGSADDAPDFQWIYAYSPYHHVKKMSYPAVLFLGADSDDRVDPMHARKMAALLQANNTGPHPILLRIEQHAGHGGADMVKQAVEQSADSYAFLMKELGLTPPGAAAAAPAGEGSAGGDGTIPEGAVGTIGAGSGTGTGYGVGSGTGGMRGRQSAVPQVRIGQPTASGDLDKAIIRRYVKRNISKITYCYEKHLLKRPGLEGTVNTQFFISNTGVVVDSRASGVDPDVASCVAAVIKAIAFPKPKGGGGVQVNYPFNFRPTGG